MDHLKENHKTILSEELVPFFGSAVELKSIYKELGSVSILSMLIDHHCSRLTNINNQLYGNLEKLDKAVEQLEQQSRDLGEFLRVYELVTSLKSDIESSREKINQNYNSFNELSEKIQKVLVEHSESLSDLEKKLLEKVRELYDDNKKYQKELDGTIATKLEKEQIRY